MATFQPKITRVETSPPPAPLASASVMDRLKSGRAHAAEERMEEALADFETGLKLDPNSIPCHLAIATIKFRQKLYAPALDHLLDVLRLDPMHLRAHLRSAHIHLAQKEYVLALTSAENAIRINPKLDIAYLSAGNIHLMKGDLAKARELLTMALKFNPRSSRGRQKLAKVLERTGQMEEALTHLNAAVRVDAENASIYQDLGRLHLLRKDFPRAREAFEQSLQREMKDKGQAQLGLAEALIGLHELDRAEQMLREAAKDSREGPRVHKLWGDVYHERGLFKEAVEEYEAAKLLVKDESLSGLLTPDEIDVSVADDNDEVWKEKANASRSVTDAVVLKQRTSHTQPTDKNP